MRNIATHVLSKFGGAKPYADLSGTPLTTVRSWEESGHIPSKQQARVLALGRDRGVEPADFFPPENNKVILMSNEQL